MREIRKQQMQVDLFALIRLLWRKKWGVLCSGAVLGGCFLLASLVFAVPRYTAAVTLYANNSAASNTKISSGDLSASKQLVDTYGAIILSESVLDRVILENGLDVTGDELKEWISVLSVNGTEVFQVLVEGRSPEQAAAIANSIAVIAPAQISEIVDGCSVRVVSEAKVPTEQSWPDNRKICLIGVLTGLFAGVLAVFIQGLKDTRIKSEQDLLGWELPVLGLIPSFGETDRRRPEDAMGRRLSNDGFSEDGSV